jgi:hypothetical protein
MGLERTDGKSFAASISRNAVPAAVRLALILFAGKPRQQAMEGYVGRQVGRRGRTDCGARGNGRERHKTVNRQNLPKL